MGPFDITAYVWLRKQDAASEWGNWKRRVREEHDQ